MTSSPQEIVMTGGVNLLSDPRAIRDDEVRKALNLIPVKPGFIGTRDGITLLPQTQQVINGAWGPQSLIVPPFESSVDFVGVASSSGISSIVASDFAGLVQTSFNMPALFKRPFLLAQNKVIYVLPGYPSGVPGYTATPLSVYPFVQFANFTWSDPSNTFAPAVAASYRFRTVYGNLGPGFEDYIVFSDRFQPNVIGASVLAANGRAFRIGDRDGDRVVALVEITLTSVGSPDQSALLVLRENTAYLITGEPNQTTDVGDPLATLTVNKFAFNCGCSAPETVALTPYGVFWAGPDDVWYFKTGQAPVRVGTKIRPALQRTPADKRYRWHGAYFNGFYRLAVAGEGQTLDDVVPLSDQWWLDLRGGPPTGSAGDDQDATHQVAQWWGPQQFTTSSSSAAGVSFPLNIGTCTLAVESRKNREPALYGMEQVTFKENTGALSFISYDTGSGRDISWGVNADSGTNPQHFHGGEIPFELLTKEYNFQTPMNEKIWLKAQVNAGVSEETRFRLDTIADAGVKTETDSTTLDPIGFSTGVDVTDGGTQTLNSATQALSIWPNPYDRMLGFTLQWRLYNKPEVAVGPNLSGFKFLIGSTPYTAQVVQQAYADTDALAAAIAAAMTAAFPASTFAFHRVGNAGVLQFIEFYQTSGSAFFSFDFTDPSTARYGAWMGFNTSTNPTPAIKQTASNSAFKKLSPSVQFGGFNVKYDIIPREPQ